MLIFFWRAFGARLSLIPISISRLYRGIYKGKMLLTGGENAIFFAPAAGKQCNFQKVKCLKKEAKNRFFRACGGQTVHLKGEIPLAGAKTRFFSRLRRAKAYL